MSTEAIHIGIEGAVATVTLRRPEKLNALTAGMLAELEASAARLERDDAIRVIVVSGAGGRAFVSGADISEFKEKRASEEAVAAYSKVSEGARQRLQEDDSRWHHVIGQLLFEEGAQLRDWGLGIGDWRLGIGR